MNATRHLMCLLGLLGVIVGVQCVKITNLIVPATYELDNSSEAKDLILDCQFELDPKETGFVLKWLFNDQSIYQWIPSHKPYALAFMKGRVDTTYAVSKEKAYKHRALFISKPLWNMTGEYTCHVQTFQSSDKKTEHMQVIVPETDFQLNHNVDDEGMVNIRCSATDVYPEPKLSILLGDSETGDAADDDDDDDDTTNPTTRDESGLYDATVERRLSKVNLESPTTINCILALAGTNYTKKRETLFYVEQSTDTTEFPEHANARLEIGPNDGSGSTSRHHDHNTLAVIVSSALLVWLSAVLRPFA